jgi:leader peptidase (prepilin peptidase)/N-methyltransferase
VAVIVAIFGLLFGSFANVLIARYETLGTVVNSRSACPNCDHQLAWYDLVPVLSFLLLGAKCRYCKKPISWQYPIIELLTALLAVLLYWQLGLSYSSVLLFVILELLVIIAVIDLYHFVIPDIYMFPVIALSLLYALTQNQPRALSSIAGGAAMGGGLLAVLSLGSKERWMGSGDIGLGVAMGLLSGFAGTAIGLAVAFFSGSLIGGLLLGLRIKTLKSAIPFGPFLVAATVVSSLWGQQIMGWYLNRIGYF